VCEQLEILILVLWLLFVVLRRIFDKILDVSFFWLLSSIRGSGEACRCSDEASGSRVGSFDAVDSSEELSVVSDSSLRKRTKTIEDEERVWRDYFANATDWWDNRQGKRNPRAPDFKHRVTKKSLWIDDWYTPAWVKDELSRN
jgi:hypothetical protein